MPTLQSLHDSALHHPGAAWLGALAILAALLLRPTPHRALILILEAEIAVDAYFTGALSPLPYTSVAYAVTSIAFVILGDLRFFYLVERQLRARREALLVALGLSLVLPIASALVIRLAAIPVTATRPIYLGYEIAFVVVALIVRARIRRPLPAGATDAAPRRVRRFLLLLCAFEVAQYALWAAGDALLLGGVASGLVLRMVANLLYYVGFVALVFARAPAELRA